MKHVIWAKATLFHKTSSSTGSGPLWVGLLPGGRVMATHRWDIPAGAEEALPLLHAYQKEQLRDDIRFSKKDHKFAILSITLHEQQFGFLADADMQTVLDGIPGDLMRWINTPEREALYRHHTTSPTCWLDFEHMTALAGALLKLGLSVSLAPEKSVRWACEEELRTEEKSPEA